MSRAIAILLLVAAGCATTPVATEPLGQRLRVRIAGRGKEPSITSAEHRIFLVLRTPEGTVPVRLHSLRFDESEGLCFSVGARADRGPGLHEAKLAESMLGNARLVHDLVLPPGRSLDFAPGAFFVCRRVEGTDRFVADADPEIRVGQITADGARYVELPPGHGIEVTYDTDPPDWPPASRERP